MVPAPTSAPTGTSCATASTGSTGLSPLGGTVVWDATSLNRQQRSLVGAVAHWRDAFVTHAVLLVDEAELVRRNGVRQHPVPPDVLTGQLHRFVPPYPGDAHRTWYVGASGAIEDTDGIESGGT